MRIALVPAALCALAACVLPACGTTPPSRFYTLEALASAPDGGAARALAIDVGPVVLDEAIDRPQMLTRLGENEVALHELSRWAEPLDSNIARVLAENLSLLTGSPDVGVVPDASTQMDSWNVTVHVLHCEAGPGGTARLVTRWRLFPPDAAQP
ncbi:MAG TPA: PqiC family protein, partial [Planctomycetota bacterium]|nr:PqiC family protein [Planctomycetota bacterium]